MLEKFVKKFVILVSIIPLFFVQLFLPYYLNLAFTKNNKLIVGVHFDYQWYGTYDITQNINTIKLTGIKVIRTYLWFDLVNDGANNKTEWFYLTLKTFNISVSLIIMHDIDTAKITEYFKRYGTYIKYVQILNEPELLQGWSQGALLLDDEIKSNFERIYNIVKNYNVIIYTNYSPAFLLRPSIPKLLCKYTNFTGLDIYMDSIVMMTPYVYKTLHKLVNQEIIITEFGIMTYDNTAKTSFIINGLNLYKNMNIKQVWLVYWNNDNEHQAYNVNNNLTVPALKEWITQNG